jgi:HSP20 family protein
MAGNQISGRSPPAGSRATIPATVARIYWEHRELLDDPRLRQLLEGDSSPGTTGECTPPMDVVETATAVEVLMDVPGVPRSGLTIVASDGTLIVAGRKLPPSCGHHEAAFHLAERDFGRFVRAVRLSGAFDGGKAHASLAEGELRVVLPRIQERRGRDIRIEIIGT